MLVYVYALTESPVPGEFEGIDDQRVRWVEAAGLVAAVSEVPAQDFDEEALNANVRDLNWLAPRAVAHDRVNGLLWERASAVLPLAFGTVFRDEVGVREMLSQRGDEFRARMDRVRGHGEWVVALERMDPSNSDASARVGALKAEIAAASAGRAHLLKRRLAEVERDELARLRAEAAEDFVTDARSVSDALYIEPIPSEAVERPLVRATLLVRDGTDAVANLVDRWRRKGYALSETGPTPPYRFAALTP